MTRRQKALVLGVLPLTCFVNFAAHQLLSALFALAAAISFWFASRAVGRSAQS